MYRRSYLMSSRVDTMKWLGILQMIIGLLIFIITVVMAAIDLHDFLDDLRDLNVRRESDERPFFGSFPTLVIVFLVVPLAAIVSAAP